MCCGSSPAKRCWCSMAATANGERARSGARKGSLRYSWTYSRAQTLPADLHYLFAPIKHARLDYMVQKAVEMGASRLSLSSRATPRRPGQSRAHARERDRGGGAVRDPDPARDLRAAAVRPMRRASSRRACWCSATRMPRSDPVAGLAAARGERRPGTFPVAVLIGPEGGFAEEERGAARAPEQRAACAWSSHPARRHGGGRSARPGAAVLGDWNSGGLSQIRMKNYIARRAGWVRLSRSGFCMGYQY